MIKKYSLIDCGDGEKLEALGEYTVIRPAPQAVWSKRKPELWKNYDAKFIRGNSEKGTWNWHNKILNSQSKWQMLSEDGLLWNVVPNEYGNIGVFVEHWLYTKQIVEFLSTNSNPKQQILNLFSYSGSNAMYIAQNSYHITAVDSSKTAIELYVNHLESNKINREGQRLILEDCLKFIGREIRREAKYRVIIADAPSYGRGTKGEVFNIEDDFVKLLTSLKSLLQEGGKIYFTLHSPRFTTTALKNISLTIFGDAKITVEELIVEAETGIGLPSGHLMIIQT